MTKESKQGLNLAVRVIAMGWSAIYLTVAFTYLKLNITQTEVAKYEESRGFFMLISLAVFIVVWQVTVYNIRESRNNRRIIQRGGALSKESQESFNEASKGKEAYIERSDDNRVWYVVFSTPE